MYIAVQAVLALAASWTSSKVQDRSSTQRNVPRLGDISLQFSLPRHPQSFRSDQPSFALPAKGTVATPSGRILKPKPMTLTQISRSACRRLRRSATKPHRRQLRAVLSSENDCLPKDLTDRVASRTEKCLMEANSHRVSA